MLESQFSSVFTSEESPLPGRGNSFYSSMERLNISQDELLKLLENLNPTDASNDLLYELSVDS